MCDPIDGSPPGSPVPGILQVRTLEWVAISFSNAWKWKVKSEREVAQSCPTLRDSVDCSLPGSSIHGSFQARVLEGVPLPSSILKYNWSWILLYIISKFGVTQSSQIKWTKYKIICTKNSSVLSEVLKLSSLELHFCLNLVSVGTNLKIWLCYTLWLDYECTLKQLIKDVSNNFFFF